MVSKIFLTSTIKPPKEVKSKMAIARKKKGKKNKGKGRFVFGEILGTVEARTQEKADIIAKELCNMFYEWAGCVKK